MAKKVSLGKDREAELQEQKKKAKLANRKKRRTPVRFFKDIISELKRVTWPTGEELLNASLVVTAFIAAFSIVVGLFDFGFGALVDFLLNLGA